MAIAGVNQHSFALFFGAYMAIFLFAGMGNGSTYRMIPAIFAELGRARPSDRGRERDAVDFKRRAAAVIGIAGAIGAFGGFLIQVAFRQASLDVSAARQGAPKTPGREGRDRPGARRLVDPGAVGLPRRLRRLRRHDLVLLPAPVVRTEAGAEPGPAAV